MAGCRNCGKVWKLGVCRCCQLIDKNTKTRFVKFCGVCHVYLCKSCWKNPLRRILAFGKELFSNE